MALYRAGTIAFALAITASAGSTQMSPAGGETPIAIADPRVGTAPLDRAELLGNAPPPGEPAYSGVTSPGARYPHSASEFAPVNVNLDLSYPTGVPSPYYYANPTIFGFAAGGGSAYGGRGEPMVTPVVGDWTVPPAYPQSSYAKASEVARPGYYKVDLDTAHVRAELTASPSAGMMRFTFPETRRATILVNLRRDGGTVEIVGDRSVRGVAAPDRRGEGQGRYWVAEFSRPFVAAGTFRAGSTSGGWGIGDKDVAADRRSVTGAYAGSYLTFATRAGEAVTMRLAHGHSFAEATQRLRAELPDWDFDRVRAQAAAAWAALLGRVTVEGGSAAQRAFLYGALYHSFASPQLVARKGERFTDAKGETRVAAYDRYGPVPFWDTGRNQIVLLEMIEPGVVADIMRSELDMARERGFMNTSFHGDNAVFLYLGAMRRGIAFPYAEAWPYLRRNATDPAGPRGYLAEYLRQGWIADEVPPGNPSPPYADGKAGAATTLEYAWDDAALSALAGGLGKRDDAAAFAKRAANWRNVFDARTGFARGRTVDGRWIAPFDPQEPYYNFMMKEASGWSTLWLVPHDVPGLVAALGGRAAFNAKLDRFFATPYTAKGICRDCTGMVGQYVQGNQPDQHAPYLYAWSGQPWKTQVLVRRILTTLYGSDASGFAYPGMDDQGATSSWYVMSAMGFYPVDPSSDVYVIGSPLFDRASLRLGNGRSFTVVARGNAPDRPYIQSATLNGRAWTKPWFRDADIRDGATLELVMGATPNPRWGAAAGDAPPSTLAPAR